MAKGKKKSSSKPNPEREFNAQLAALGIPNAPAQKAGLKIILSDRHARSETQAFRSAPWEGCGLSERHQDAAQKVAEVFAEMRDSPAPRSCLDICIGGYDGRDDTDHEARQEREFWALTSAISKAGMAASSEVSRVCWMLDRPKDARALAAGLEAAAVFFG